jgi:ferric-dicitrate binding protein FerR (iron transport regulator)
MDDFFLDSTRHPAPGSNAFWEREAAGDPALEREIEIARHFLMVIRQEMEEVSGEEILALWNRVKARNARHRRPRLALAVAAGIAALVTGSVLLYPGREEEPPVVAGTETGTGFLPGESDDVVLVLAGQPRQHLRGEEVEISHAPGGKVSVNAHDIPVTGDESGGGDEASDVPYNHLIVPVGKRSSVLFPDGTRVWVNARSHVWYPVTWAGDRRQLFVEGEVFVDVAPDEARPFIVNTGLLEIEVLGTRFNVTARDTTANTVVLERGKVNVKTSSRQEVILHPDQRLEYRDGAVSIDRVDVQEYAAWKDGLLYFNGASLDKILDRLGNYYGKEITRDPAVVEMTCSGKLELKPHLEEVLEGLARVAPVRVERLDGKIHITNTP